MTEEITPLAQPAAPAAERRRKRRFRAGNPLSGEFAGFPVTILDFGEGGFRIEHAQPLKIGARGQVRITNPETRELFAIRGRVAWSYLSKNRDEKGKFLYSTGITVE
ncbi:MAG TPA: PilZ domain-containing protein, partial [Thermoanaerobaculia bacterium]|nr:PilZ domain-containing protein [Thermoanaerobaculia bacterium]